MTKRAKRPKKPTVDVYAVLWTDAVLNHDKDKPLTPVPAITFGVVVKHAPNHVQVAGEIFADESYRQVTSIPAAMGVKPVKIGEITIPQEWAEWRRDNDH